jgi:hypothetical protein
VTPVLEKPYIRVSINPENIRFLHFTNGGHARKSIMAAPMFLRIKRSICIKLFLSIRVIQSIYATRLHPFGSFDWRPQHVPEGLNLWQKVSTYHNYGQCCVISLYRFHSCSKIEPVNKILSPDHVIVTEPFCYARK